jgi:hypothetical protein
MQAEAAARTFGLPKKTSAIAALEDELWRTAGHVEWLAAVVASLEATVSAGGTSQDPSDPSAPVVKREGLFDWQRAANGMVWRKPSVWIDLYQSERKHLLAISATLVKLGVDKDRLDVIRSSGLKMAGIFQAVLADPALGLTSAQLEAVPDLIRRHIAAKQIES